MRRPAFISAFCLLAAVGIGGVAQAQSLPSLGGSSASGLMSNMGGLGGMLGKGVPSVSSAPTGNVAGVLGYCVQNNAVQGAGAASTLGSLTSRGGVTTSPGYSQGQQGILQTGGGNSVSMSGMNDQVRGKVCDMVLSRAKSMI